MKIRLTLWALLISTAANSQNYFEIDVWMEYTDTMVLELVDGASTISESFLTEVGENRLRIVLDENSNLQSFEFKFKQNPKFNKVRFNSIVIKDKNGEIKFTSSEMASIFNSNYFVNVVDEREYTIELNRYWNHDAELWLNDKLEHLKNVRTKYDFNFYLKPDRGFFSGFYYRTDSSSHSIQKLVSSDFQFSTYSFYKVKEFSLFLGDKPNQLKIDSIVIIQNGERHLFKPEQIETLFTRNEYLQFNIRDSDSTEWFKVVDYQSMTRPYLRFDLDKMLIADATKNTDERFYEIQLEGIATAPEDKIWYEFFDTEGLINHKEPKKILKFMDSTYVENITFRSPNDLRSFRFGFENLANQYWIKTIVVKENGNLLRSYENEEIVSNLRFENAQLVDDRWISVVDNEYNLRIEFAGPIQSKLKELQSTILLLLAFIVASILFISVNKNMVVQVFRFMTTPSN